ncbi:MAG: hypothetical protein HY840_14840, partial [Bacteroidetes bacterium]|nr:hypothetical protein [Bacteroidota bacterium]
MVVKVATYYLNCQQYKFQEIEKKKLNAIDTLIEVSQHVGNFMKEFNPSVRYDLQKYYPEILKMHIEYKRTHIINNIKSNLQKGIEERLYRTDINTDIVAKLYFLRLEAIFDEDYFPHNEYHTKDVFSEMFRYHIYGIASKKGLQY